MSIPGPRASHPHPRATLSAALLSLLTCTLTTPLQADSSGTPADSPNTDRSTPKTETSKIITLRPVGHRYQQEPLADCDADIAYICLGGFGDEIGGIVQHLAAQLRRETQAPVAYYHWHGGQIDNRNAGLASICDHIRHFRTRNPQADIVIIGHSMGAASGLLLAQLLLSTSSNTDTPSAPGRICLITLDPADRSVPAERPKGLAWWGNAYIVNSQSARDFIPELGGRWLHCPGADLNIRYDGRDRDEYGRAYIHDDAGALLMSRYGSPSNASLWQQSQAYLSRNRETSTSATPTRE